ncbi:hypothetical protein [Brevibacillus centrosporus]|uniref:hypothetical protein n=1 Tax=Brevibacillus centrosporus TaxID=54910 RepID=UPI0039866F97
MMKNRVKEKLKNGEKTVGAFVGIYSPEMVEMLGHAGFDFLVIDDEHGAFSPRDLENMIRAAECVDLFVLPTTLPAFKRRWTEGRKESRYRW